MATIRLGPTEACERCHKDAKALFRIKAGIEAKLCQTCSDNWYDTRDYVVHEAFKSYMSKAVPLNAKVKCR